MQQHGIVLITIGVFYNCYARILGRLCLRKRRGIADNAGAVQVILANPKGIIMKLAHPIVAVSAVAASRGAARP
jgi:filamentous hemagglutinin family protein